MFHSYLELLLMQLLYMATAVWAPALALSQGLFTYETKHATS